MTTSIQNESHRIVDDGQNGNVDEDPCHQHQFVYKVSYHKKHANELNKGDKMHIVFSLTNGDYFDFYVVLVVLLH